MVKSFSFLILFICVNVSQTFSQPTIDLKTFDCTTFIGICINQEISTIRCPLKTIKGKKNQLEFQCSQHFFGSPILQALCTVKDSALSRIHLTLPGKDFDSLHSKLILQCAALTEKRNNQIVSERLYSFVDGYRISTKLTKNVVEVDISLRDENSLIQKNKLELIPFFGFEVGEPTSLMRGYDVRGPAERFSFRPNAKIAGVQLFSQFVKVDAKGVIQSMHLVTNPQSKKDSDDLIAYFRKNSVRSKKSKKETDKNTFLFANGYMIVVLEEDNSLYHFMITKSKKSSQ